MPLPSDHFAFEFDSTLLFRRQRQFVLEGPQRANGGDVATLGAEEGVKVETLDVIELDLHGFV